MHQPHRRFGAVLVLAMLLSLVFTGLAAAAGPVHWSYSGDTGPAYWGSLSPEFAACSAGKEQSPVNIPADALVDAGDLKLSYQPTPLAIVNNGHTIEVEYHPGSTFAIDGTPFTLAQFHLHSDSEHTLADQRFPMELHLVHKAADGRLAVIGVMVKAGAENPAWAPVLKNMPAKEGTPQEIAGVTVNAADFLPADKSYYRYNGSLTTPPCSEGVNWFVMKNPVELSQAQIDQFRAIYKDNYRPVQALNGRSFLPANAPLAPVPAPAGAAPAKLPTTGGPEFAFEALLAGLGLLGAGAYLRARRSA
jgi:carbonic anhydrase